MSEHIPGLLSQAFGGNMNDWPKWGEGFRILCVDDDALNLRLRSLILERAGCEVTALFNPTDACEAKVDQFDLIILDFDMPRLNGYQLFLALRERGVSCPVMLLSGGIDSVSIEAARCFTVCLAKGQRVPLFLEEVRRQLQMLPKKDEGY
jgi:two-component system capsular synthesis sensor histidine kinase RcsC